MNSVFEKCDYFRNGEWDIEALRIDLRMVKMERELPGGDFYTRSENTGDHTVDTMFGEGVIVDTCGPSGFVIELSEWNATIYDPVGIPTKTYDARVSQDWEARLNNVSKSWEMMPVPAPVWVDNTAYPDLLAEEADQEVWLAQKELADVPVSLVDEPRSPTTYPDLMTQEWDEEMQHMQEQSTQEEVAVEKPRKRKRTPAKKARAPAKKARKRAPKKSAKKPVKKTRKKTQKSTKKAKKTAAKKAKKGLKKARKAKAAKKTKKSKKARKVKSAKKTAKRNAKRGRKRN